MVNFRLQKKKKKLSPHTQHAAAAVKSLQSCPTLWDPLKRYAKQNKPDAKGQIL